jgi:hypothetical protein
MKRAAAMVLVVVLGVAASGPSEEVGQRAWQQRLQADIPLPVPMVAVEAVNPFATPVDELPKLLGATPPRKLDVTGLATAAAYVDAKGACLGAVPLELPFPGLTSALVAELGQARFEPARTGNTAQPSWVVVAITVLGRVKESVVSDQSLELPDPSRPPEPKVPPRVAPPGNLLQLPAVRQSELTSLAAPRRLGLKAPGRDAELAVTALVHATAEGRCDRFVPLDLDSGFEGWLSAYLATWRLQPAVRQGQPVDCWVVYRARVQVELSGLESTAVRTATDSSYDPNQPAATGS